MEGAGHEALIDPGNAQEELSKKDNGKQEPDPPARCGLCLGIEKSATDPGCVDGQCEDFHRARSRDKSVGQEHGHGCFFTDEKEEPRSEQGGYGLRSGMDLIVFEKSPGLLCGQAEHAQGSNPHDGPHDQGQAHPGKICGQTELHEGDQGLGPCKKPPGEHGNGGDTQPVSAGPQNGCE